MLNLRKPYRCTTRAIGLAVTVIEVYRMTLTRSRLPERHPSGKSVWLSTCTGHRGHDVWCQGLARDLQTESIKSAVRYVDRIHVIRMDDNGSTKTIFYTVSSQMEHVLARVNGNTMKTPYKTLWSDATWLQMTSNQWRWTELKAFVLSRSNRTVRSRSCLVTHSKADARDKLKHFWLPMWNPWVSILCGSRTVLYTHRHAHWFCFESTAAGHHPS